MAHASTRSEEQKLVIVTDQDDTLANQHTHSKNIFIDVFSKARHVKHRTGFIPV